MGTPACRKRVDADLENRRNLVQGFLRGKRLFVSMAIGAAAGFVVVQGVSASGVGGAGMFPGGSVGFASAVGDCSAVGLYSAVGDFSSPSGCVAPTSISTTLSGWGQSGTAITVAPSSPVIDHGLLSGANVASATGTVTYSVYADPW